MAIIQSGATIDLLTVDPTSKAARTSIYDQSGNYIGPMTDSNGNKAFVSPSGGRQRCGLDDLYIWDPVDGTAINTNIWLQSTSTMTITQTLANGILLNAGGSIATSVYAIINSIKNPARLGNFGVSARFYAKPVNLPETNAVGELGFGVVATTAAPTDGSFFRWTGAAFQAVVNFNGTETTQALSTPSAAYHTFEIVRTTNAQSLFFVDEVLVATLTPGTNPSQSSTTRMPIFARVYSGGSAPALAPQLSIASVSVAQLDINWNKQWADVQVGRGLGAYQSPITAFGQTANHANSASPSSATLSNTAAGYTTLGGRYQFAAPAGAATDFALFGYQVPAGYQLYVTSVKISAINTGAAVATTATILDWGVGVNASAVSLATADGAGTWAPRRIPLGTQGFIVGAAIGAAASDVVMNFSPPLCVDASRFFHVILQVPVGTATASQVIRGDVTVNGYFE